MIFKWSDGGQDDFPKLVVKVRPEEIVTFGAADEITVNENGIVGGGKHLKPKDVHKLLEERDDVVFFDGRNKHEAAVGKFKDAVVPDVKHTRDFVNRTGKTRSTTSLKTSPSSTYCTGGIRCEVLSALMKNRGFKEVYQIDGGIAKYGENLRRRRPCGKARSTSLTTA